MKKTVAALTAVLMLGAVRHGSAQSRNPFVEHADTGEIIHVLPAPASIHSPHDTEPTTSAAGSVPQVFNASYGSGGLVNHFGPVITNAIFLALYWNNSAANARPSGNSNPTLAAQMDAFIDSFGKGATYSQAPTDDFAIVQQYSQPTPNTISSTVSNYHYFIGAEATRSSVSDSGIRNFIAAQFNAGRITPANNIIYGVYLPPGMKVTMSGSSCSTFCGYHGHFNYGGTDIRYAVFPYLNCSACSLSGLSVADMMTIVASHEIREAVTDPMLNAWYDNAGYEADDKCAWHHLYQMTNGGFYVQPEYSNGGTVGGVTYAGPGCVVP